MRLRRVTLVGDDFTVSAATEPLRLRDRPSLGVLRCRAVGTRGGIDQPDDARQLYGGLQHARDIWHREHCASNRLGLSSSPEVARETTSSTPPAPVPITPATSTASGTRGARNAPTAPSGAARSSPSSARASPTTPARRSPRSRSPIPASSGVQASPTVAPRTVSIFKSAQMQPASRRARGPITTVLTSAARTSGRPWAH